MYCQLKFFKDGGIADSEDNPTFMRCRETVQIEVMLLPPAIDIQPQMRQTLGVKNWFFLENT